VAELLVKITLSPVQIAVDLLAVILGFGIKLKSALVEVPTVLVTETLPLAPSPTTALIVVLSTTVNEVAAVSPKLTPVAPIKILPVMVTVIHAPALVGLKELIVEF
jgi:hypothetical protein